MSGSDRDHAAEQENSAANLAHLDVDDTPVSGLPGGVPDDLEGETTEGEDDIPHPDRSTREPQE
ncbi:hypothetical protein [uncultured Sphingomonas sp.]|jgi:hypothetical protein|uniref:hypothetical protein n=1 Tax=uncultured Sphingomonas sp. TaxID=158754 RepID=UPI00261A46F4|nr:hypothetical protein [uncultured Sphingomonas sp.]